jgi:hypothetical protein
MVTELHCDLCGMKVLNNFDDQQKHIMWHDEMCEALGMPEFDGFSFSPDRPRGAIAGIQVTPG